MEKIYDELKRLGNSKVSGRNGKLFVVHEGGNNKRNGNLKDYISQSRTEFESEDNDTIFHGKNKSDLNLNHEISNDFDISLSNFYNTGNNKNIATPKKDIPTNRGGGGGGNDMEKRLEALERKTEQLQVVLNQAKTSLAVIEDKHHSVATKTDILELKNEVINAINALPKEDNIRQLISTTTKADKLVSETFVETKILNLSNAHIKWTIGTGLAVCGVVFALLRYLS